MKRADKHLRYSSANRRPQLDEARYGSLVKLLILLGSVGVIVLAAILVSGPLLRSLPHRKEASIPEKPVEPASWSNEIRTLPNDGWIGELSEWSGTLLYSTGASADSLSRLIRLNLESGENESVSVPVINGSIRCPYENNDWILYGDYASDGSGCIRIIEKKDGSGSVLFSFQEGAPLLFCSFPYVVFTARTAPETYTLTILDVRNGNSVAAACFSGPEYGASSPSIRNNQIVYSNIDADHPDQSILHWISLSDGFRSETVPKLFLHDPILTDNGVLALSGLHSSDSILYRIDFNGTCEPIARSVVRYAASSDTPVFSANGSIFCIESESKRTVALSEAGAFCELLGATDSAVIWVDRSQADHPAFCFLILH